MPVTDSPAPPPAPRPTPTAKVPIDRIPVLADGRYDAHVSRVQRPADGGTTRLVVDLVQVFRDQAAVDAAVAHGQSRDTAQVRSVSVRNQNPRLRTLPLASDTAWTFGAWTARHPPATSWPSWLPTPGR